MSAMPASDKGPLTGRATATELVDYQDDAIVSRTLLRTDHGSITVFAFDRGQSLSEHSAPHDAVIHILDGEAEIRIEKESHRLTAGELILLPANRPHAVEAPARFKMLLVMLK